MRHPLAIAVFIVSLAFQPAKVPKVKRIPEGKTTQVTQKANGTKQGDKEAAQPTPSPANTAVLSENKAESQPHDAHANKADDNIEIQRNLEIFTGLLVLVGLLQAGIFLWQGTVFRRTLNAINRQADIYQQQVTQMIESGKRTERIIDNMRDTAVRQLRAYVCLSAAQIAFKQSNAPEIQVNIKNCGQTPAYDVHQWIHTWIEQHPLKVVLPEPPPISRLSTAVLPPSGENIMVIERKPPISQHILNVLGTPQATLYIYGKVTYKDAFGNEQYTNYRLIHGGAEAVRLKNKNGIPTGLLKPDTSGNDAT